MPAPAAVCGEQPIQFTTENNRNTGVCAELKLNSCIVFSIDSAKPLVSLGLRGKLYWLLAVHFQIIKSSSRRVGIQISPTFYF